MPPNLERMNLLTQTNDALKASTDLAEMIKLCLQTAREVLQIYDKLDEGYENLRSDLDVIVDRTHEAIDEVEAKIKEFESKGEITLQEAQNAAKLCENLADEIRTIQTAVNEAREKTEKYAKTAADNAKKSEINLEASILAKKELDDKTALALENIQKLHAVIVAAEGTLTTSKTDLEAFALAKKTEIENTATEENSKLIDAADSIKTEIQNKKTEFKNLTRTEAQKFGNFVAQTTALYNQAAEKSKKEVEDAGSAALASINQTATENTEKMKGIAEEVKETSSKKLDDMTAASGNFLRQINDKKREIETKISGFDSTLASGVKLPVKLKDTPTVKTRMYENGFHTEVFPAKATDPEYLPLGGVLDFHGSWFNLGLDDFAGHHRNVLTMGNGVTITAMSDKGYTQSNFGGESVDFTFTEISMPRPNAYNVTGGKTTVKFTKDEVRITTTKMTLNGRPL